MNLIIFEVLALAIWICTTSAENINSEKCEKIVDLANIRKSLRTVHCDKIISLEGFQSTTALLRSLVCQCKWNKFYVPRQNSCIDTYNANIITPIIQQNLPQIIQNIHAALSTRKVTQNQICEAIQIFIDVIGNIGSACIGCALTFHDHNNGQSAQKMTDTCYNGTLNEMTNDYLRYQSNVPTSALTILRIIEEGLQPINKAYYGPEIRGCFGKFSGQNVDFCECNRPNF